MSRLKIGELAVYPQQASAANECINAFLKGNLRSLLLVAQPQQGKTGVIAIIVDEFINACLYDKVDFRIILLTNISDNTLKNQNVVRFTEAGLVHNVEIVHHGNLNKVSLTKATRVLIIVDECHVALRKDHPFDKFMRNFGISYGNSHRGWTCDNVYVLSVSATPFAHEIQNAIRDRAAFERVILEKADDYYGFKDLQRDGRLRQAFALTSNSRSVRCTPTPQFLSFLKELKEKFDNGQKANKVVLRMTGQNRIKVAMEAIKSVFGEKVTVNDRNCKAGDLQLIDQDLSTRYPHPTFVIIRGALRAGKTLTTTEHIAAWVETSTSSKGDTVAQSVGRCMGYGKRGEMFPIYCTLAEVDTIIDFYDHAYADRDALHIPSGAWNGPTTAHTRNYFERHPEVFNDAAGLRAKYGNVLIKRNSENKASSLAEKLAATGYRGQYGNLKDALGNEIKGPNGGPIVGLAVHWDGPAPSAEFAQHYRDLVPDGFKNKVVLYTREMVRNAYIDVASALKPNVMFENGNGAAS